MFNKPSKGFTLVELLVVVAIIGLLSSIVTVSLSGARQKSRDNKRVADIKNLQIALSLYFADNVSYPASAAELVASGYLQVLPTDPRYSTPCTTGTPTALQCYKYTGFRVGSPGACTALSNAVTYQVGAIFEDTSSRGLIEDVDTNLPVYTAGPPPSGYGACNGGSGAFDGTSIDCSNTAGTSQPGGTELCYSLRP